jgi:hypothetical protein
VNGHPVPISAVMGDGAWARERMMPPIWTMVYWLIAPASTLEILGLMFIIAGIPNMVKDTQGRLILLLFMIPLAYLSAQPVKLPQYLTVIKPGFILCLAYGCYKLTQMFKRSWRALILKALILILFVLHSLDGVAWKQPELKPFFHDVYSLTITFLYIITLSVLTLTGLRGYC